MYKIKLLSNNISINTLFFDFTLEILRKQMPIYVLFLHQYVLRIKRNKKKQKLSNFLDQHFFFKLLDHSKHPYHPSIKYMTLYMRSNSCAFRPVIEIICHANNSAPFLAWTSLSLTYSTRLMWQNCWLKSATFSHNFNNSIIDFDTQIIEN